MGSIIKTTMYYSSPFWREDGFAGTLLSDEGPVMFTYDDTKPGETHPAIMGFVLAKWGRAWSSATKEDRKTAITHQYARLFGNDAALHPIGYEEHDWSQDPFSGGCYTGWAPPGVLTSVGSCLRVPIGPIHFAGTETARVWQGYIDGAIEAGERAAVEVCDQMGLHVPDPGARWGESLQVTVPPLPLPDRWIPSIPSLLLSVLGLILALAASAFYSRVFTTTVD